jgi:hypothetical protein
LDGRFKQANIVSSKQQIYRIPLVLLALLLLTSATWAGLIRLGWRWPAIQPALPLNHGPLMVAGFFGTLIALERAVAIQKPWAYIGPLFCGIGGMLLVFDFLGNIGPLLLTLGSAWLVLVLAYVLRKHWAGYMVVMALGACALLVGNVLWLSGWQVYQFVFWWAGFLVLTIAGERLELGRMVQHSLVGLALWLLLFDIARRTIKQSGLTRFIAICLLSGYAWLIVSGAMSLIYGGVPAGPIYDTMLHSIFLGFVFSMIFGHAPIIFPAILKYDIEYRPIFYLPLILLHLSLILRTAGELSGHMSLRLWGGILNVLVISGYLVMISPLMLIFKKESK